jgi:magnesium chelatase subunit D
VVRRSLDKDRVIEPFIVLITDGRATFPTNGAFAEASREAALIGERKWPALCIDTESGPMRLSQTRALAEMLRAEYVHTDALPESHWAPIIEEWLSWQ